MTRNFSQRANNVRLPGQILIIAIAAFGFWLLMPGRVWQMFHGAAHAANTYTVTNTNNSDAGSLRQAILDANGNPGQDTIAFNISGSGVQTITVTSALPTITDSVVIDGYTQPGASANTQPNGNDAVLLIEVTGNHQLFSAGLLIQGGNSTVRGLIINSFGDAGIRLSLNGGNVITGNIIGTNADGATGLDNNDGVNISFCNGNTIGGTTPDTRNVISGNGGRGIFIGTQSSSNLIQGNFIGTNLTGTAALPNLNGGIFSGGMGNDTIGGTASGARNVISGNLNNAGVQIQSVSTSLPGVTVQGNFIGIDVTGTAAIGNFFGVWLNFASNATIGGQTSSVRNLISGNRSHGVLIANNFAQNNRIYGNYIGTDVSGILPLGNAGAGVDITSAPVVPFNRIGDTSAGSGNVIAFNGRSGVAVETNSTAGYIRGNSIFSNSGLGIDLGDDGVTPNDPGDGDPGPNRLQNFPIITSVTNNGSQTTISGTLNSTPNATFFLSFYSNAACDPSGNGEGAVPLLNSFTVVTNGSGDASFNAVAPTVVPNGRVVTATATDQAGNTSEFSPCDSTMATGAVQFTATSTTVIENAGFVTVSVVRTGGALGTLSVDYSTSDISARAGQDYTATSGTLMFTDGETLKSFDVPILGDAIIEPDETFAATLHNASNVDSLGVPQSEVITIQNHTNIGAEVQFNSAAYSVGEGDGSAIITVTRSGNTSGTSTVDFATSDGSALQSRDYLIETGTVTFGPGETSKTFGVPVVDDVYSESNETVNLTLSNAAGATLGSTNTTTLTINDNDGSGPSIPPKRFMAALDAAQEMPPSITCPPPPGICPTGSGMVLLNSSETSALVGLQFFDLTSAETAAHIHTEAVGVAGPITFPLAPPITNPITDLQIIPTTTQVADLKAGQQYMNVHSSNFPNGEIRGQLLWNPTLEMPFFIRQHYLDFLNREPDPDGLLYWLSQINCPPPTQGNPPYDQANVPCFHDRTVGVSDAFFFSGEFHLTASFVFKAYRAAYGNTQPFPNPDPGPEAQKLPEYNVFMSDRPRVLGGASLAQAQLAFTNLFVSRPEFTGRYGAGLNTGSLFVDAVLANIQTADGVVFSSTDRQTLIDHYNNAGGGNAGRALVMWHLSNDYWNTCSGAAPCVPAGFAPAVDNRAYLEAEYNREFALTLYFGYLRRNPEIGGFLFWQDAINQAPVRNQARQIALVCSFVTSGEYQARFGPFLTFGNGFLFPRTNAECR
jgi:hypothetical protein